MSKQQTRQAGTEFLVSAEDAFEGITICRSAYLKVVVTMGPLPMLRDHFRIFTAYLWDRKKKSWHKKIAAFTSSSTKWHSTHLFNLKHQPVRWSERLPQENRP